MSTNDYFLQTLPLAVHKTIYSFLGPNANYSNTCRDLHEINKATALLSGLNIASTIEPRLLTSHGIPLVNAITPYPDQGLRIQKAAFFLVKKTWPLLSPAQQTSFHGISLSRISVTQTLFRQMLLILNTIDYRKTFKVILPLKTVPRQQLRQTKIIFSHPQFSRDNRMSADSSTSWRSKKKDSSPPETWRTAESHAAIPSVPLFIVRRPQSFNTLPPITQKICPPAAPLNKK